jgi:hypothetical protein
LGTLASAGLLDWPLSPPDTDDTDGTGPLSSRGRAHRKVSMAAVEHTAMPVSLARS